MPEWPDAVERVSAVLRDAKVEARLEEFPSGTPTAQEAADAAGCDLAQIVKSLIFACDGRWALVMVPGDRRADRVKVAAAVGCERVSTAGPEDVVRVTGFQVGAVAPFPLPAVEIALMERSLLSHDVLWVGAGSTRHMAALAPTDLARLTRARTSDLLSEERFE
jgi:prolyl-tRNA editing enzyme YbaK/EbsC (Cys-tRNA(Pro) deacylase)